MSDSTHDLKADDGPLGDAGRSERIAGAVLAVALVIAATAGLVWGAAALFPGRLPTPSNPSFVDNIFNSRGVIWAARLLLVSAAVVLAVGGIYIVVSTFIRMKSGEWLKRAGPFEVSETALTNLEDQIEFWRGAALDEEEELVDLRLRVEESEELIERLHLALDGG